MVTGHVKVKVLTPGCEPTRADGSAGIDLRSAVDIRFTPGDIHVIPLGIIMKAPEGYVLDLRMRSGLAAKGFMLMNGVGTIDANYCGPQDEIKAIVKWSPGGSEHIESVAKWIDADIDEDSGYFAIDIMKGDRIAQIVPIYQGECSFEFGYEPDAPSRGGLGSTGIK